MEIWFLLLEGFELRRIEEADVILTNSFSHGVEQNIKAASEPRAGEQQMN
jgi:translation initiation factor 2B subunit (eIF-2B alpha/beta/delta family)